MTTRLPSIPAGRADQTFQLFGAAARRGAASPTAILASAIDDTAGARTNGRMPRAAQGGVCSVSGGEGRWSATAGSFDPATAAALSASSDP